MSDDLTFYELLDEVRIFGDVILASNEKAVCATYEKDDTQFIVLHSFDKPQQIQLMFNELEKDKMVTRTFTIDPNILTHVITRVVREAKTKREEAFI